MKNEVQIERHVGRQDEIEKIVRVKRERIRIAGQRLPAAVVEVPVRNLAHAKNVRSDDLDRIVGGEVVAEEEESEDRDEPSGAREHKRQDDAPSGHAVTDYRVRSSPGARYVDSSRTPARRHRSRLPAADARAGGPPER